MTKICSKCGKKKSSDEYYKRSGGKDGLFAYCNVCAREAQRKYRERDREKWRKTARVWHRKEKNKVRGGDRLAHAYWLLYSARRRAKQFGVPFSLRPEDVIVPAYCPVLNVPLIMAKGAHAI